MKLRVSLLFLLFGLTGFFAKSQTDSARYSFKNKVIVDTSLTVPLKSIDTIKSFFINKQEPLLREPLLRVPKNGLYAASIIFGTNMDLWLIDRFIINGAYARINFNTIKDNFKKGFVWDNDMFVTNLFAHPYHGGQYFNAARANGMNFWESIPYTAGGSLMWELFMENETPAINDFLSTTFGGLCLGEATFRLSDMVIDDRTSGFERFKREALVVLISPGRGLSRILNGQAWKQRKIKGNIMSSKPVTVYSSIGHRIIADDAEGNEEVSNMLHLDWGLDYGNPYDSDNELPYDFFSIKIGINMFSEQPTISRVNAIGMLYSKNIRFRKQKRQLAIGLFQHFNYYESRIDTNNVSLTPYKLSEAASFGPGLTYMRKFDKLNTTVFVSTYLSAILLGGSQTDHYIFEDRDYNMGSGFSTKLNLEFIYNNKWRFSMNSEDYRIYSWVGYDPLNLETLSTSIQGDKGNASLTIGRTNLSYIIKKHVVLGVETSYYFRKSVYKYYPDVEHGVVENKISLGYYF